MAKIDVEILDFDGTLAKLTPEIFFRICNKLLSNYGHSLPFTSGKEMLESPKSYADHFQELTGERNLFVLHHSEISPLYEKLVTLYRWVPQYLEEMQKQRKELVICSANNEQTIRRILGTQQTHFSNIWCGQKQGHRKPSPAFYEALLESMTLDPSEVRYVTDDLRDAMGAWQAGIRNTAMVVWGVSTEAQRAQAWDKGIQIISKPHQLWRGK